MKQLLVALVALTFVSPAFAGTKAPAAVAPATVVDASGKPISTEKGGNVTIATAQPEVVAPAAAPAPVKHSKKKHGAKKSKPAAKVVPVAAPAQ